MRILQTRSEGPDFNPEFFDTNLKLRAIGGGKFELVPQ